MLTRKALATAVAAALLTAAVAQPAAAATATLPAHDPLRTKLTALVDTDAFPGALASVTDRRGRVRQPTAGVAVLGTNRPVPVDGQVRIGSNTKTFVAVVMLQLVAEHRVRLDAPVDTYLPGLLRGRRHRRAADHRTAAAATHQRAAELHRVPRRGRPVAAL